MMTDPVGDMLTRIRNAGMAGLPEVRCPTSRLKRAVAQVMHEAGYLGGVRVEPGGVQATLVLDIRFRDDGSPMIDGLRRVSRPGRRVYVKRLAIRRVRSGLGIAVLSTSRGVLSDRAARRTAVGGEVLCEVW